MSCRNGQLKEYIAAGATKDDFVRRITASLATIEHSPDELTTSPATSAQPQAEAAPAPQPGQLSHSEESSVGGTRPTIPPASTGSQGQSLADEKAEESTQQKKKDDPASSKPTEDTTSHKSDEQQRHVEALKKKQREAREERERVLKAIEDDKAARKAGQAEQAAARQASLVPEASSKAPSTSATRKTKSSEICALQVRLFDGSTIRNRFPSGETLKDVRKWIAETREDIDDDFTFKVLLTPLPSKTIAAADEDKTLRTLELTPSATLIIHRVRSTFAVSSPFTPATSAAGEPQGNFFQRLISLILAAVTGPFSTIFAFFSSLFSTSGPPPAASEPTGDSQASGSQSRSVPDSTRHRGGRVAGVDQTNRRRDDQQFYNGNSVSTL